MPLVLEIIENRSLSVTYTIVCRLSVTVRQPHTKLISPREMQYPHTRVW